jgi:hypothetical protein
MTPPRCRRCGAFLALLLAPALLIFIASLRFAAQGPYWAGYSFDPEYPYLFNALNLLQGRAPWHIDHPGTPLQLLLAAIMGLRFQFAGSEDSLRRDVLLNPEPYLRAGWLVLTALSAAALAFFGWAARRFTQSTPAAVIAQASILTSSAVIACLSRVNPEPLLLSFALLLAAAGFLLAHREAVAPLLWWRGAPAAGAILGIAIATKITFAPLALAALFLRRGVRFKLLLTAASIAAFLISIAPIAGQHQRVTAWLGKLFWGSGRYGTGEKTIIDAQAYPRALWDLIAAEPALVAAMAASFFGLCLAASFRRRLTQRESAAARLLLGVVLAQSAMLAMVAKMPDPRYLVPASALIGANVVLIWILARALPRLARYATVLLLISALAFAGHARYRAHRSQIEILAKRAGVAHRAWEAHASLPPDALIVVCFRSSAPPMALIFGDGWAGDHRRQLIQDLYPRYIMQIQEYRYRWGAAEMKPEQVHALAAERPVYLHALKHRGPSNIPHELHQLIGHEAIFRILQPNPAPP